jgi:PTS system nitrogen regulatory IIA component
MQLMVRDVARLFKVSEKTIYRWVTQGGLPAYRVNKQYRFNRAELLEWATAKKINVAPELIQEPESSQIPLPSLADALSSGGIFYRVEGHDKDSVMRNVVRLLRLPEAVDRDFLLHILLAREALGSTGVGDGIAIPHVRNPIVLNVEKPAVTLTFLEKPVEYGSLDRQPVGVLFMLVSPTVRAHLHLLSRLAFALKNPSFKDVVMRQGSRDEILHAAKVVEQTLAPIPAPAPNPTA